jgi:hypothetical protein
VEPGEELSSLLLTTPMESLPTLAITDDALSLLLQQHCLPGGRIKRGFKKPLYASLRTNHPKLHSAKDHQLHDFVKNSWDRLQTQDSPQEIDESGSQEADSQPVKRLKTPSPSTNATKNESPSTLPPKRKTSKIPKEFPPKCPIEPPRSDQLVELTDSDRNKLDAHLLKKVSQMLASVIHEIKEVPLQDRPRTFPITRQNLRTDIINELNFEVGKYLRKADEEDNLSLETLVDGIYGAQLAYQRLTERRSVKTDWKRPCNDKIQVNECLIALIDKKRNNEKITKKEKRTLRQLACSKGKAPNKDLELDIVRKSLTEENDSIRNKIRLGEQRTEFSRQNYLFETKRGKFYRGIEDKNVVGQELEGKEPEILQFWQNQWLAQESDNDWNELLDFPTESREAEDLELNHDNWIRTIKDLPDWKAAGPCKIFNFFIKNLTETHPSIVKVLTLLIQQPEKCPDWFFTGNTFLVPKKPVTKTVSDFRPITCMSNLYKLLTKVLTEELTNYVEATNILSINQMGTIRKAQGAKEQALFNRAINAQHSNELFTAWIDVQKAFDSVDHAFLIALLEKLQIPTKPKAFILKAMEKWKLDLFYEGKPLGISSMKKGILQGDSLSPLLFVLVMEPLSRALEKQDMPKIELKTNKRDAKLNHLLFIDDIKLFAKNQEDLEFILDATVKTLAKIGLQINSAKSNTNYKTNSPHAQEIGKDGTYKYLGIQEDANNKTSLKTKTTIQEEMFDRIHKLCQTRLHSRNLFKAINEYALSVLNYQIALVDYTEQELEDLDRKVRTILRTYKAHFQPASLERLYLSRKENGRGLNNIVHKAERITLGFNQYLSGPVQNIRKDAIWEMELKESAPTAFIGTLLAKKYPILEGSLVSKKNLIVAQTKALKDRNSEKVVHSKFYTYHEDPVISQKDSPKWLLSGTCSPQEEGKAVFLQDRNVYYNEIPLCSFCNAPRTLEHVASSCKLLLSQYTVRHNEILKCIHKAQVVKYGFTMDKRIKRHRIEKVIRNMYAEISTDVKVETERPVSENRPDLVIKDHKHKLIYIVDVAVCHRNGIATKEIEKRTKYEVVRRELSQRTGYQAVIIPYVISWDGQVSTENWQYRKILGISDKIHCYIQQVALRETVAIVCRNIQGSVHSLLERLTEEKTTLILGKHLEGYRDTEEEPPVTPPAAPE